jgi:hypothetical protein
MLRLYPARATGKGIKGLRGTTPLGGYPYSPSISRLKRRRSKMIAAR